MADPRYRGWSFFSGDKRVAEIMDAEYDILSNDETVYADVPGGVAGYSDGAVEGTIRCTAICPVAGMSVNFETLIQLHQNVDFGVGQLNGHIHQSRGRVMRANFTTDVKTGIAKGVFEFRVFSIKIT